VGEEALEKGKQVATVAVDTLKEEAERQELTPEKLAEKVRTVAKEATNTVKEEGKRQASDLKETVKADTTGTPGITGNAGDFGSTTPTTGGNVTTSSVTGGPQGVEQHEPEFTRK
jgi:chemotaxis response regulator CheB